MTDRTSERGKMTDDREYEFVCDVCKRELYSMPTYDHDQIDGEEWFHKDDETVACDAWEVAPDLYEEVQTVRAQLAALRDERDRAVRVLKAGFPLVNESSRKAWLDLGITPADFDYLRQLIESEDGQ